MELVGMVMSSAPGMLDVMAETFVEENVRLDWGEEQLLVHFRNPCLLGTYRGYQLRGEAYVRELIRSAQIKWRSQQSKELFRRQLGLAEDGTQNIATSTRKRKVCWTACGFVWRGSLSAGNGRR